MTEATPEASAGDRFKHFEYPDDDFPFYDGAPVALTGSQWWFVLAMTLAGFLAMVVPVPFFAGRIGRFIPAILFPAVPLVGLAIVTRDHWMALFRRVRVKDVLWMVAFALLNLLLTLPIGWLVMTVFGAEANPAIAGLAAKTTTERMLFVLKTAPSLLGEEVMTMLPFLAMMYLLHGRMNRSRKASVLWAWLGSAVLFGLAHLPTYNWNWVQCLIVIGSARLVLSLAYIKTKNLWVSTGAHILNDWSFFALTLLGAAPGAG